MSADRRALGPRWSERERAAWAPRERTQERSWDEVAAEFNRRYGTEHTGKEMRAIGYEALRRFAALWLAEERRRDPLVMEAVA